MSAGQLQPHDGVAPLPHALDVVQLINKTEGLQPLHDAGRLSECFRVNKAVDAALGVADADGVDTAPAVGVGFIRDDGKDFLIVGERKYAVDQLCFHGTFSKSDADMLRLAGKYLAAWARSKRFLHEVPA